MRIDDIGFERLRRFFDWPSEPDQIWRHLADYTLTDLDGFFIDMEVELSTEKYIAKGTLLARPGTNQQSIQQVYEAFRDRSLVYTAIIYFHSIRLRFYSTTIPSISVAQKKTLLEAIGSVRLKMDEKYGTNLIDPIEATRSMPIP
jgi:hypothetical protein